MERINPDLNALCGPMFIFFLALTALRSLGAGKQDRLASKLPEGTAIHAADRPAAEEGASSTKPAPSNQGPENPSQQPQQQPQSSSHVSPGAFEPAMAQRSIRRLPGKTAPTSENYFSGLCVLLYAAGDVGPVQLRWQCRVQSVCRHRRSAQCCR